VAEWPAEVTGAGVPGRGAHHAGWGPVHDHVYRGRVPSPSPAC